MHKEFANFLKMSFKFILVFAIVELSLGTLAQKLFFSQTSGKHARITNSIKTAEADLFVFGSSHAFRHYVPSVLEKELNLSVHNAGVLGQKLLFSSLLFELVLQRTRPEVVILNIDSDWLFHSSESYDRLTELNPYYWDYPEMLKPWLSLYSETEPLKLHLKSYQYNSTLVHAVKYYFLPQPDVKGYVPLHGHLPPPKNESDYIIGEDEIIEKEEVIDEKLIAALDRFITLAKKNNVKLFFVRSPGFMLEPSYANSESYQLIKEIAEEEGIPLLDFYDDKRFVGNYTLFKDPMHLNDKGARLFSELVADSLKQKLKVRQAL